jgi:hypothetical protein
MDNHYLQVNMEALPLKGNTVPLRLQGNMVLRL